jgi:hypothetical protein
MNEIACDSLPRSLQRLELSNVLCAENTTDLSLLSGLEVLSIALSHSWPEIVAPDGPVFPILLIKS